MPMHLNTNISSLRTIRSLTKSTNALDKSLKHLASGLRINSAKDDAAGLQISDRMTAQINGLEQGNRNAQDGISFCQTAEGALEEMTTMYQRIRQLAVQSANGTNSNDEREAIQQEVTALCDEIKRVGEDTTFGGIHLLNKKLTGPTEFQVGANSGETISLDLSSGFRLDDVFMDLYNNADVDEQKELLAGGVVREVNCGGNGDDFNVTADFFAPSGEYNVKINSVLCQTVLTRYVPYLEKTGTQVSDQERTFGEGTITFTSGSGDNAKSLTIQVSDGDTMSDIRNTIRHTPLTNYGNIDSIDFTFLDQNHFAQSYRGFVAMRIFTRFGSDAGIPFSISTSGDEKLKIFECNIDKNTKVGTYNKFDPNGNLINGYPYTVSQIAEDTVITIDNDTFTSKNWSFIDDPSRGLHIVSRTNRATEETKIYVNPETTFCVNTESAAQSTIGIVDRFIGAIDKKRAEIGAVQKRLEHAISNQENVAENLYAARSRIRDTDYAAETAEHAKQNILQQVSSSILVSANHTDEIILSLLNK